MLAESHRRHDEKCPFDSKRPPYSSPQLSDGPSNFAPTATALYQEQTSTQPRAPRWGKQNLNATSDASRKWAHDRTILAPWLRSHQFCRYDVDHMTRITCATRNGEIQLPLQSSFCDSFPPTPTSPSRLHVRHRMLRSHLSNYSWRMFYCFCRRSDESQFSRQMIGWIARRRPRRRVD
jgi:hypothetical protein